MSTDANHDDITYEILMEVYNYICDGRIYLARDQLEKLLNISQES